MFFPEGTRVPPCQKRRYKTGGTRVAIATGTPVIPVAHNAGEFWKRKGFFKKAGTVHLCFGPAISPEGHTPESLMKEVETWIENKMPEISPAFYKSNQK